MGIVKRISVALAPVIGIGMLAMGPVSPADAAPAPAPQHGSYQNGCTLSPDTGYWPVYYNFHSACDWHDLCYHYHWRTRLGCDDGFKARMRSWCANRYDSWYETTLKLSCYGVAETYYRAVRTFGGPFY
jgi:hypothetical protein